MKNYTLWGAVGLCLLFMGSCMKEKYDPEICDRNIRIELDFIEFEPLDETERVPIEIHSITARLGTDMVISSPVEGVDVDLEADLYSMVAYETVPNISVDGTTISVTQEFSGMASECSMHSGGAVSAEVYEDLISQVIHIPMHLQSRPLIIQIRFTGYGADFLDHINGRVDGIAFSRHINNGFVPTSGEKRPPAYTSGSVAFPFIQDSDEQFTAQRCLLGIDGDTDQNLNMRVYMNSGNYRDFDLDITEALEGFHTVDVVDPYYILLTLNLGANFEIAIEDWAYGSEQWLVAQ